MGMPVIPALERQRQEDEGFKVSMGYISRDPVIVVESTGRTETKVLVLVLLLTAV
jgi:hypothetical protein